MELTIERAEACLRDPACKPLLKQLIACGRLAGKLTAEDVLVLLKDAELMRELHELTGEAHRQDDILIATDMRHRTRVHRATTQRAEAREDPQVKERERENDRLRAPARRRRKKQARLQAAREDWHQHLEQDRKDRKARLSALRASGLGLRKCGETVGTRGDLRDNRADSTEAKSVVCRE